MKAIKQYIHNDDIEIISKLFCGNGCRQVWCRYPNKNFKEVFFCKSDKISDKLETLEINSKFDYYITKNAFYADKRSNDTICYLDNIVIDIDNHNSNVSERQINYEVSRLLYLLSFDYANVFPTYSLSVKTGRGVQLWIHIDSIAPALLFLYEIVVTHLCNLLTEIIKDNEINLTVDYQASLNPAGLVRLPFTYNTSNNCYIDNINFFINNMYDIDYLISEYDIKKQNKLNKINKEKNVSPADEKYKPLHYKRMNYLEDYVKCHNYDVIGHRNAIIFLYYNACVQVMERSKALERTEKLNKSFKVPYSASEFKTVIKAVDKHIYKLNNQTFFEILNLTAEEQQKYISMSEYKPKVDKAERNKKIFSLAYERKTQHEIADTVGCSVITVKRILKDFNKSEFIAIQVKELRKTMTIKQVAESLNISTDTVKRLQKSI